MRRDDVRVVGFADLDPRLRAMVLYEQNGAFDVEQTAPIYSDLLATTPVLRWDLGVAFFSRRDIVAAARDPRIVSTEPTSGEGFGMGTRDPLIPLHIDGDAHAAYRRLLDPLLTARQVAVWADAIRSLADALIDGFVAAGETEFMSAFAAPLPGQTFMQVFGLPDDDLETLVGFKDRILKHETADLAAAEETSRMAGDELRVHLRRRLAERKEGPGREDLLGRFLTFELGGQSLSDDEIINLMHMFIVAGLDTVTASLSLIVAWLASHPEERRRLVDDPALLPTAIDELLRVLSPVPYGGPRWATEDMEVNGVPVAKGSLVFLGWGTANVDPDSFDDPGAADLARRPNPHLAFAAGTHRCLGSHLARLELRIALEQFHRRIPDYAIAPGEKPTFTLQGVRACQVLPLVFPASR